MSYATDEDKVILPNVKFLAKKFPTALTTEQGTSKIFLSMPVFFRKDQLFLFSYKNEIFIMTKITRVLKTDFFK